MQVAGERVELGLADEERRVGGSRGYRNSHGVTKLEGNDPEELSPLADVSDM